MGICARSFTIMRCSGWGLRGAEYPDGSVAYGGDAREGWVILECKDGGEPLGEEDVMIV